MPSWEKPIISRNFFIFISFIIIHCCLGLGGVNGAEANENRQRIHSIPFIVEHPARMDNYGMEVAGAAQLALRRLNKITDDPLMVKIRIVIIDNETKFHELVSENARQSVAVSVSGQKLLIINLQRLMVTGSDNLPGILVHELMHIYLDVRCMEDVPTWLHEGLAQIAAQDAVNSSGALLTWRMFNRTYIPFSKLAEAFPVGSSEKDLAYTQSLSFVHFLIRKTAAGNVTAFINSLTGEKGIPKLNELSSEASLKMLESEWVHSVTKPANWMEMAVNEMTIWFLALILVGFAFYKTKQRSRKLREMWDKEDSEEAVWSEEAENEFAPTWDPTLLEDNSIKCETSDWEPDDEDEDYQVRR